MRQKPECRPHVVFAAAMIRSPGTERGNRDGGLREGSWAYRPFPQVASCPGVESLTDEMGSRLTACGWRVG